MRALLVVIATCVLSTASEPSVDEVVAQLDAYLAAYEPKLSELIADEAIIQETRLPAKSSSIPLDAVPAQGTRRVLLSDVAFVALPNDAGWLGVRSVRTIDGRAVESPVRSLSAALHASSYDTARGLLDESAAQDLGLPRTTNLPNLPLEFLHQRNRRRLVSRLHGTERVRGAATTRVVFTEQTTPALIQTPAGADMPSLVRAWVDRTGRLLRAEVMTFQASSAVAGQRRVAGVSACPDGQHQERRRGGPGAGVGAVRRRV